MIVHKHWLIGVREFFWPLVSLVCSGVILYVAPVKIVLYVFLVWAAASVIWFARNFFDYYLDAWIITNIGVIDLAWHGWFHRQSTRILYSDIQGVTNEIQGILSTLFNFGKLTIEKISTGALISLEQVPHPRDVEMIILRNMESYMHSKNMKNAKHVQEILSTFIADQIHAEKTPPKKEESKPVKKKRFSLKKA